MTHRLLLDRLIGSAAVIWGIDPIDLRKSPGATAKRARVAIAYFAYRHGCELQEILRGFERGGGSQDERKDYRHQAVQDKHYQYLTTKEEYRARCLELMKAVGKAPD